MPVSDKKKASNARWDAKNLKRMSLAVPVSLHDRMVGHIDETGETMNGFIKRSIETTLNEHDQSN